MFFEGCILFRFKIFTPFKWFRVHLVLGPAWWTPPCHAPMAREKSQEAATPRISARLYSSLRCRIGKKMATYLGYRGNSLGKMRKKISVRSLSISIDIPFHYNLFTTWIRFVPAAAVQHI